MSSGAGLTVLLMSGAWYEGNAYMSLLSDALREQGVDVRTPGLPVAFPLTRALLRNRDADVVQLDWLYDYYATDDLSAAWLNDVASVARAVAFLLDLLVVSALDVRVVRTVHNERSHDGAYPRTERVVTECVFAVADAVTVKCEAAADRIAAAYRVPDADNLWVVPDGNYVGAYENEVTRADARRDLGIDDARFVFVFFGRVRPYKGVPELIEAFASLELPDAELLIAGNPASAASEARVRRLAASEPQVRTTLSFVPDDRIQYYLNAADVLVLPYRRILNSGSAYLGLSFGTPIVAPAIGCLPETVPPENDLLYDPADDDGLSRALRRAYGSSDLDAVARANRRRARTRTWERTCERLLEVYADAE